MNQVSIAFDFQCTLWKKHLLHLLYAQSIGSIKIKLHKGMTGKHSDRNDHQNHVKNGLKIQNTGIQCRPDESVSPRCGD